MTPVHRDCGLRTLSINPGSPADRRIERQRSQTTGRSLKAAIQTNDNEEHMLLLTAEDVRKALPMSEAIEAMKNAYAALSNGTAVVPLRTRLPIPGSEALSL